MPKAETGNHNGPRILILDIETSPNLAYTWGLWKQTVGLDQLIKPSEMISWAAKWYGEKEIMFKSVHHNGKADMLKAMHKLLNEADAVVHFNGMSFDMPIIRQEFFLKNMTPPSPCKQIDLMQVAKHTFRFQSNKLQFICKELGIGEKEKHEGFGLWVKCLENDPKAWALMKKYNMKDVEITEKLYTKVRPWIHNHPFLYGASGACPKCGSNKLQRRGYRIAIKHKWQRLQCQACGGWSTGEKVS